MVLQEHYGHPAAILLCAEIGVYRLSLRKRYIILVTSLRRFCFNDLVLIVKRTRR